MKYQNLNLDIKAVQSDGFFSGYGSVNNNVDSYRDMVLPGAFAKSIKDWESKGKMPPVLWQHRSGEPIGVYTKIQEDDHGLHVEGQLLVNDVVKAKEAHALLKAGAIDGLSIGYEPVREEYDRDTKINKLLEIRLWEVSIVTFPANSQARIDTVKSMIQNGERPDLPEFEKFLRDAGFSKSEATAIASHGYRQMLRDAADPVTKAINESIQLLKGSQNG